MGRGGVTVLMVQLLSGAAGKDWAAFGGVVAAVAIWVAAVGAAGVSADQLGGG